MSVGVIGQGLHNERFVCKHGLWIWFMPGFCWQVSFLDAVFMGCEVFQYSIFISLYLVIVLRTQ